MEFNAKCSDDHFVKVPHYAAKYSFFFNQLAESAKDGYWQENECLEDIGDPQKTDEGKDQPEKDIKD